MWPITFTALMPGLCRKHASAADTLSRCCSSPAEMTHVLLLSSFIVSVSGCFEIIIMSKEHRHTAECLTETQSVEVKTFSIWFCMKSEIPEFISAVHICFPIVCKMYFITFIFLMITLHPVNKTFSKKGENTG